MRVHHLNCGTMCPIGSLLFYRQRDPRLHHLVCHCLLIETADHGLVLVDTGLGIRDVLEPEARLSKFFLRMNGIQLDEEQTALSQIHLLGYQAHDVRHIILTHLDFDHAGGIEDFPEAIVHVFEPELHAATHPTGFVSRRRYRPQQWDQDVRWQTYKAAEGASWQGFACVRDLKELPPELLMVPLAGHTAGHCGIAIQTSAGWMLHAGDAYFDAGEMHPRPRCAIGLRGYQRLMEVDRRARLANQARLRSLAQKKDAEVKIFCSHDASELQQLSHAAAGAGPAC